MNRQELKPFFQKITEALEQKRLKEVFDGINALLTNLSNWQLNENLSEWEDNYKRMLLYLSEGVNDPEQEKIYTDLLRSVYQLTDQTIAEIKTLERWTYPYELRRSPTFQVSETSEQLIGMTDDWSGKVTLVDLMEDGEEKKKTLQKMEEERGEIEEKLFRKIWLSNLWKEDEQNLWLQALNNKLYPISSQCLIISAITLNLEEIFDERKVQVLLDTCEQEQEELRQRALTGLLLFLRRYDKRLYLYPNINNRLQYLAEQNRFIKDIRYIILQFILSKETEKITRIMTEEIIPGMMKISPKLNNKMRMDELFGETGVDEKNPEWQNILEESGLSSRLQEFSELQLEGADVMLSSFIHLKNFPFFREIHNWFIPFVSDSLTMENLPIPDLLKILLKSNLLCNSDKYSFYFSISQMTDTYREMMSGRFSGDSSAIRELLQEELPDNPSDKIHPVARQYIQDLYRFFKLFPRHNDFDDVFEMQPDFYKIPAIARFISDQESQMIIGEYYFQKNHFTEAAEIFEQALQDNPNNETLLQKKGYCLQMLGKLEEALSVYLKAELLNSNHSWTIKKLAYCYRALKQPREALEYYRKAAALNPNNLSIELHIGHCYLELKDYSEALKCYFKVEYLSDNKEKAWRPIAWCSFLTGKYKEASDYYTKILESNPNAVDYLNAGHTCLAMGKNKEALNLYRRAINAQDDSFEKFLESFTADIPDLLQAGVNRDNIPILLDCLTYGIY
ncbi:MAG: tetratricopeptide repeat protein [Candidatus Azobacteroides sp.]|nr:tetratricopeptide repeat protein [Candidatus Azobacteroides sp.]